MPSPAFPVSAGRGWGREQGPSSSLVLCCSLMAHLVFIHNYIVARATVSKPIHKCLITHGNAFPFVKGHRLGPFTLVLHKPSVGQHLKAGPLPAGDLPSSDTTYFPCIIYQALWKWRQRVPGVKFSIGKYIFYQTTLSESAGSHGANIQVGEY